MLKRLPPDVAEGIPRTLWRAVDLAATALFALGTILGVVMLMRGSSGGVYILLVSNVVILANSLFRPRSIRTTWHPDVPALLHDALLAERVCPVCLYAFDSDRLTDGVYLVCSECGAAWFPPLPPDEPTPAQHSGAE